MAEISFVGYVEEWTKNTPEHPDWAMRVSEAHRKKDGDKWVTVARTYRTIKAAYATNIDFTQFKKGDRVQIDGKELTEVSERDGKKYENLVVKAEMVEKLESGWEKRDASLTADGVPAGWSPVRANEPVVDDDFDAPF